MNRVTQKHVNEITYKIIGAAIEVHRTLGPGLLEQAYEPCLEHELQIRDLYIEHQRSVPVEYKGLVLESKLRYDLLVEDCVIVELKAVALMQPVFEAQIMTYMRLLKKPKGVLLNFFCTNMFKEGQKTFVNEFFRMLPEE